MNEVELFSIPGYLTITRSEAAAETGFICSGEDICVFIDRIESGTGHWGLHFSVLRSCFVWFREDGSIWFAAPDVLPVLYPKAIGR